MDYQITVSGEWPFKCPSNACGIGSTAAGYKLYFAIGKSRPEATSFQPFKDADGDNVEVAADHPLLVMCAAGTWFMLKDNTGDVVITY